MSILFKPDETFRGDFHYSNSPEAIRRFPFPFDDDQYMYSVNIEPHTGGAPGSCFEFPIDVDEHYIAECRERAICLDTTPHRYMSLPHMTTAQWDALELIMTSLARDYPDHFHLEQQGTQWRWTNRPLNVENTFVFGDVSTLPLEPLEYITRQTQGDWTLLDQREGTLWLDAGMVTSPADWSLYFDFGMNFMEWHKPVPLAHQMGVFDRALKYLLNLQYGNPVRRLNWSLTIHPRLDTSTEQYHEWGPDRNKVTLENAGELVHLRVELQALWRLPRSNSIAFSIRSYLISLQELATVPGWAGRLCRVLENLRPELVEYKGLTRYKHTVVEWLSRHDTPD
ncbi:MAG: DUF3445 domain-containing protein [Gemmataceae bacterium]